MSKIDEIQKEIRDLVAKGKEMLREYNEDTNPGLIRLYYEIWYTSAHGIIKQLAPDRLADFQNAYKLDRRKGISYSTYCINDYLSGVVVIMGGEPTFNTYRAYSVKFLAQVSILSSVEKSLISVLRDVRSVLRAELFDNDLDSAREMIKNGHLRSAGVIGGVVLEGHLKSILVLRAIKLAKKLPSLADLNEALKGASAYDIPTWRYIQRLGDIRNLCCHSGDREPTRLEVEDLIAGVDKVIKEVF